MTEPIYGGDRCPTCGKVRYLTKDQAKKTAKRIKHRRGGHLNAYRCGQFWHLGHLPKRVVDGRVARSNITTINRPSTAPGEGTR